MEKLTPAQKIKNELLNNLTDANTGMLLGDKQVTEFTTELSYRLSEELILKELSDTRKNHPKKLLNTDILVAKKAIKSFFSKETVSNNPYPKDNSNHETWNNVWWFCKERSTDLKESLINVEPKAMKM